MIELTEEPYDGEVGQAFVAQLLTDLNERYASELEAMTPEEVGAGDADYLAEVRAEDVRRPHGVFLVAWRDGEPVGCGALRRLATEGVAEIKRMYTVPSARRQGISKVLLDRLEAAAVELGYRSLRLETGAMQPEAVALYAATGWRRIEPYGFYRESEWSICFAKDLPGS